MCVYTEAVLSFSAFLCSLFSLKLSDLYSAVKNLLKEKDLEDAKTSQFIAFRR